MHKYQIKDSPAVINLHTHTQLHWVAMRSHWCRPQSTNVCFLWLLLFHNRRETEGLGLTGFFMHTDFWFDFYFFNFARLIPVERKCYLQVASACNICSSYTAAWNCKCFFVFFLQPLSQCRQNEKQGGWLDFRKTLSQQSLHLRHWTRLITLTPAFSLTMIF